MKLALDIAGIPQQQGSKTRWGTEENAEKLKPWRMLIATMAQQIVEEPTREPVAIDAAFTFPRPKHHFGTGRNEGVLKEGAPLWHTAPPDLDKLQRAVGDALKGVVIHDDRQIVRWRATKRYGERPGLSLSIATV